MTTGCGTAYGVGPSGTFDIVNTQVGLSQQWANDSFSAALQYVQAISEFTVDPVNINISFDADGEYTPFEKPTAPAEPTLAFALAESVPAKPSLLTLDTLNFPTAPTFTAAEPELSYPARPVAETLEAPGDAPTLTDPTVPTAPTVVLPAVPTIRDLNLPAVPDIDLSTLKTSFLATRATRPDIDPAILDPLVNDFVKQSGESQAAVFDVANSQLDTINLAYGLWEDSGSGSTSKVMTRVGTMLDGGTGLPAAVEQALADRAVAREDVLSLQAESEVAEDWSRRGFALPSGLLQARLQEVRQKTDAAKRQLLRDIFIRAQDVEIENLRFSVQQGLAAQDQSFRHWVQLYGLSQDVAVKSVEFGKLVFDAKVDLYRVSLDVYRADLDSYKTWIEVEFSELEEYKALLEGQKLVGDMNLQDVAVYKARVEGALAAVDIYKAQVEGVRAMVETDVARIQGYRATVDAYTARVGAKAAEFQSYAEQVKAESTRIDVYEAQAKAFAERIRAYGIEVDAEAKTEEVKLQQNQLLLAEYTAQIQAYQANYEAEAERIKAGAQIYDAKSKMYSSELGAESARALADTRAFELSIAEGRAEADLRIAKAGLNVQQTLRAAGLELEALSQAGRVSAQLAASSMSAVNIGASISGNTSSSDSTSCSTSYNISSSS